MSRVLGGRCEMHAAAREDHMGLFWAGGEGVFHVLGEAGTGLARVPGKGRAFGRVKWIMGRWAGSPFTSLMGGLEAFGGILRRGSKMTQFLWLRSVFFQVFGFLGFFPKPLKKTKK